jgi:hypothetical protein
MNAEASLLKVQSCISMYGEVMIHWKDISEAATQVLPSIEFG